MKYGFEIHNYAPELNKIYIRKGNNWYAIETPFNFKWSRCYETMTKAIRNETKQNKTYRKNISIRKTRDNNPEYNKTISGFVKNYTELKEVIGFWYEPESTNLDETTIEIRFSKGDWRNVTNIARRINE